MADNDTRGQYERHTRDPEWDEGQGEEEKNRKTFKEKKKKSIKQCQLAKTSTLPLHHHMVSV